MAKRGATSELNDRNWDDEEEPEEAGIFVQADKDTLQSRVIKRAKRRGAGEGDSKPSAFSGFGGLSGTSSSKPTFPSFKPTGNFGSSLSTFTLGAKSSIAGGASSFSPLNGSNNSKADSKSVSNSGESNAAYFSFLKSLNQSVLAWIKQHVEENPYIILTPVFKDYEKYLAKQASENSSTTASSLPSPAAASRKDAKDSSNAGAPVLDTKNGEAPKGFLFGGSPLTKAAETSDKSEDKPEEKTEGSKGFSLGASTAFSGTGGFSFGSSITKTTESSSTSTTLSKPGFAFGTTSTTAAPSTGFAFDTTTLVATSSGFSFGAKCLSGEKSGFSFGAPKSTATTSGFSFAGAASLAASKAASSSEDTADKNGAGDDEYVPPKPEVKEIKEDDALYSKKCKLYFQRDNQWVDRGVGNIHLKPVEESKTQVLIRADTNLGNILLNVMLSASMPVSRQGKNNVFLVCVPNPPVDTKASEEDQKKPVPMLVRVKTGEDADELFKFIEDRKALL